MQTVSITEISPSELENLILRVLSRVINQNSFDCKDQVKELLNIEEACELLSIKKPTLYQKVSRREIPFLKRSKILYFKREDLIKYLEKGRVKSVYEIQEEAESLLNKKGVRNG
jgi:excisionase family DNA binding protein